MINTVQVCLLKYIRYTVNFELPCQKGLGRYISSLFLQQMNNPASVTLVYTVGRSILGCLFFQVQFTMYEKKSAIYQVLEKIVNLRDCYRKKMKYCAECQLEMSRNFKSTETLRASVFICSY